MHRTIWTVFKVLIISMSMMLIMDFSIMIVDFKTSLVRINAIGEDMRYEASKNNCIPNDLAGMFSDRLEEIGKRSSVIAEDGLEWNINEPVVDSEGNVFAPINEENIRDYGEGLSVIIKVTWHPHSYLFGSQDGSANTFIASDGGQMDIEQQFEYPTYAGRYLK